MTALSEILAHHGGGGAGGGSGDFYTEDWDRDSFPDSLITERNLVLSSPGTPDVAGLTLRSDIGALYVFSPPGEGAISIQQYDDWDARWRVLDTGVMGWSGGGETAVIDTTLYRSAANVLKTDDAFVAEGNLTAQVGNATEILIGEVASDVQGIRFAKTTTSLAIDESWGDLMLTQGTGIGTLTRTGNEFTGARASYSVLWPGIAELRGASASGTYVSLMGMADTDERLVVSAQSGLRFGPGNAALDVNLYRQGADVLMTDDYLWSALDGIFRVGHASQVEIGDVGSGKPGLAFGSAADTNLFRESANLLCTNDSFYAIDGAGRGAGLTPAGLVQSVVSGPTIAGIEVIDYAAGATPRFRVKGDGTVEWGTGGAAADTNLYRSAANILKTDDAFHVAATGRAAMRLTTTAAGQDVGITFDGNTGTTEFYKPTGGSNMTLTAGLTSTGSLMAQSELYARSGHANVVTLGSVTGFGSTKSGIVFGSGGDTNLFRMGANSLATDDAFTAIGYLSAMGGETTQILIGAQGPASEAGIKFGLDNDTNLYRGAANTLRTDDTFRCAQLVVDDAVSWPAAGITNVTTDRSFDANSYTTDELADVLGTLIADLRTAGVLAA